MEPTIVFIHGLYQGLAHLAELPFPAPASVTILDLLGYGEHAVTAPPDTMEPQVKHVLDELDRRAIPHATLVGHSVGGAVAMLVAAAYPDRVRSVINVEGNFTLADAFWSSKIAGMPPEELEAMVAEFRSDPGQWLTTQKMAPTKERVAWAGRMFRAQPAAAILALAKAIVRETGRPEYLQRIEGVLDSGVPVHLFAGERSRAGWNVPGPVTHRAASITTQPRVGHMMPIEDPAEFLTLVAGLVVT